MFAQCPSVKIRQGDHACARHGPDKNVLMRAAPDRDLLCVVVGGCDAGVALMWVAAVKTLTGHSLSIGRNAE